MLLRGTEIDISVKKNIRGLVARAGGRVEQLVEYGSCTVEDVNIPDGGFGKVWKAGNTPGFKYSISILRRLIKQEIKFLWHGHRISRDRKTIILDMHDAHKVSRLKHRYDCSISSNLLEHSPNPIWLLLNFHFITREEGHQFHAIPHYSFTYDKFRAPTPLEHMIEDFEKMADASDSSHVEDYRQSAIVKDGWQKKFHEKYPLEYPYIHFHVFDENNTKALFEFVFQDVTVDIYKNDRFSDNVIICSNSLNPKFAERYKDFLQGMGGNGE
ncbi:MAG: hypothetical protein QY316_11600 [Thermodesulfobacteriota bacterium]|nr:MAG: hypothetical protein QY316_11600 [Thermodesulfobacteriota bacterium]